MSDEVCSHCGLKPLKECQNSHIPIDGNSCRECPNMKLARKLEAVRSRMTPEMLRIPHVSTSPLYRPRKEGETGPTLNRTKENLHITGITRRGLLAHLKLIVMCQTLRFNLIDDAFLTEVYLGKSAYQNKPKAIRDTVTTYNSPNDLIGSDYDLVILTVGIQSYKNASSASQILEALKRRCDVYGLPLWLLEPPGCNWYHSRDDAVDEYLTKHFTQVELESGQTEPEEDLSLVSSDSDEGLTVDSYKPQAAPAPKPRRLQVVESPNLLDDFNLVDGTAKPKFRKGKR